MKAYVLLTALSISTARAQPASQPTMESKNPLLCDIATGVCGPADSNHTEIIDLTAHTKTKLIYYTDPICSACWAIEPQLRKLKSEYGHAIDIEYRMGGLLPKWDGFADRANGIASPKDVAPHWDEVGHESGMSIDGDVWLEDPLSSSFPPSIAYYAVRYQGSDLALLYLRRIREMVFLEKTNIAKTENLVRAAKEVGANTEQFLKDFNDPNRAPALFEQALAERAQYGVRGFPTFIWIGADGKGIRMSGMQPYTQYVAALQQAAGKDIKPVHPVYSVEQALRKYGTLSTRELAVLLDQSDDALLQTLRSLVAAKKIQERRVKFGSFWSAL